MAFELTFTDNGIIQPTASEVRNELADMFTSVFGTDLVTEPTSPQGQLITSLTTIILEKNAKMMEVINAFNPANAKNDKVSGLNWQDAIGNIYLLTRKPATSTSVNCIIGGRSGTVIPATAKAISTNNDIFQISQSVTIPDSGTVTVQFLSVAKGQIPASVNTINRIYTPVVGWDTVNNPSVGILGNDIESRESFEARRKNQLSRYSSSLLDSIKANIAGIDNVTRFKITENDTDQTVSIQSVNLKPHSIYLVVEGGIDNEIGRAIRVSKSAGCSTNGSRSYSDEYGTLYFDRPQEVPMYVTVNGYYTSTTPDTIKEDIKKVLIDNVLGNDERDDALDIAESCFVGRFFNALSGLDVSLSSITVGKSSDSQSGSVSFNLNQVGTLSSANIVVNLQNA